MESRLLLVVTDKWGQSIHIHVHFDLRKSSHALRTSTEYRYHYVPWLSVGVGGARKLSSLCPNLLLQVLWRCFDRRQLRGRVRRPVRLIRLWRLLILLIHRSQDACVCQLNCIGMRVGECCLTVCWRVLRRTIGPGLALRAASSQPNRVGRKGSTVARLEALSRRKFCMTVDCGYGPSCAQRVAVDFCSTQS